MSTQRIKSEDELGLFSLLRVGKECLTNRFKSLALVVVFCHLLPSLMTLYLMAQSSKSFVAGIKGIDLTQGTLSQTSLFDIVDGLLNASGVTGALVSLVFTILLTVFGLVLNAKICLDYFESSPRPLQENIKTTLKVLATKGVGVVFVFLLLLLPLAVVSFIQVFVFSLLWTLPFELFDASKPNSPVEGARSFWRSLMIKYASPQHVWRAMFNLITVTGLFTAVMALGLFLNQEVLLLDVTLGLKYLGYWGGTTLFDVPMVRLGTELFSLLVTSVLLICSMAFYAAVYTAYSKTRDEMNSPA